MKRKQGFRYPAFFVLQQGKGQAAVESRPDTPTRHPDPTPDPTCRHPDTERKAQCLQSDASGCKGGKAYASGCKRMQAKKQEGRGKGERGKGQAGANLAKRRKRKKPWRFQRGVFISRGV